MALATLGSNANNSLSALVMSGAMAIADIASFANGVLDDKINGNPIYPGAFAQNGLLYVPNRGILKVLPGDYVAIDNKGWPILVSANSIATAAWTHVP